MTTNVNNQINQDEQIIFSLIKADKKKTSKDTVQEMKELLIEYILAKMSNQPTKEIQAQIDQVLSNYQKELSSDDDLIAKVKAIVANPDDTTLSQLQTIIAELEQKLKS